MSMVCILNGYVYLYNEDRQTVERLLLHLVYVTFLIIIFFFNSSQLSNVS